MKKVARFLYVVNVDSIKSVPSLCFHVEWGMKEGNIDFSWIFEEGLETEFSVLEVY